jgi:hypothetical protein
MWGLKVIHKGEEIVLHAIDQTGTKAVMAPLLGLKSVWNYFGICHFKQQNTMSSNALNLYTIKL